MAPQHIISAACEEDLIRYGDSFRGAGYTRSAEEAEQRYATMLDLIREREEPVSLLDLGCGLAHMLDYIDANSEWRHLLYSGLDISSVYLEAARARHPEADLILLDILERDAELPEFDYVILNGLFNYRGEVSQDQMLAYWKQMLAVAFAHCRRGLAFNVMSTIVDWERDDLFHLPFDPMAQFVG